MGRGGLSPAQTALGAGVLCYLTWGFVPLVFQAMGRAGAGPWEIMGHRALWGVVWAGLLVLLASQTRQVMRVLRRPATLAWLAASTVLIAINWTVYVMAVNSGRTLDASLGYYLNPLLNMAAGAWLFRERIDGFGKAAIGAAALGVVIQAFALGHPPWVSLALAFSFGAYGIIRKRVEVDAQAGLFIECLFLTIPGAAYVGWLEGAGQGHFFDGGAATFWLAMSGPVTVVPLALFSWAARRMPLSTMGFLQFLAPTIAFFIGVAQGEPFTWLRGVSFGFIWAGAVIFAVGAFLKARGHKRTAETVLAPEPGLPDDPAEDRMDALGDKR
jgi:chloramphenicol-sensitive protein RarD